MQVKSTADEKPIRSMSDERLDFDHATPLRKSYIIASSPRSGSTFLSRSLAQTGVLGAPSEVLNPGFDLRVLKNRFKATSPADYIAKLLARRTSSNGVFGIKAHFQNFEAFLAEYPTLLEVLSPVTFIYINRQDKVAQAVSMAKALQTNQWSSLGKEGPRPPLQYDRELIAKSLKEVELQDAAWPRWFEANDITPFRLTYEDLVADPVSAVRSIVELLDVQHDERDDLMVPPVEKQSDDTNEEWIERFVQETRAGAERRQGDPGGVERSDLVVDRGAELSTADRHFFDRHDRLIKNLPKVRDSATGFIDLIRLRHRYDAIIGQNREMFHNARVLDIISFNGFWSLAALDAGAAHVVAVETSPGIAEAAAKNFTEYRIKRESYQFIQAKIMPTLKNFKPEQFDVILCKGFFEYCNLPEFFGHLSRLRPRHVVVDTKIAAGEGPLARFAIGRRAWEGSRGRIMSTPTHDLMAFLCESEFQWRLIDWQAMGITDWTGIPDYARGSQRTYVLDRLS